MSNCPQSIDNGQLDTKREVLSMLLKAPEAMALLNVKPTKFYDLQKQGLVVAVSFGPRCKRYDRADLLAVVEKLKRPALPDQ